jgi:TolB-like protein
MIEQAWDLGGMAGAIAVLALVAWIVFTPPRPSIPAEGPVRIAVRPFQDLAPDPEFLHLGDKLAREMVALLQQYDRIEAAVGEEPARFVMEGAVRKTGPRIAMSLEVTSGGRRYWRNAYDTPMKDVPKAQAKAVEALAKAMKLAPKKA